MNDNNAHEIRVTKLGGLDLRIIEFDKTLERILSLFAQDTLVWDLVAGARDALFRLQQGIHGCDVLDFTSSFEDPWINLQDEEYREEEQGAGEPTAFK